MPTIYDVASFLSIVCSVCLFFTMFWTWKVLDKERKQKRIVIPYYLHDKSCVPQKNGDWIDARSANDYAYKAGDMVMVSLGISVKLPQDYEMHLLPRSSTFKNYGVTMVNSMGIIDHTYCGKDDVVCAAFLAHKDGKIKKGDRVAQFKFVPNMDYDRKNYIMKMSTKDFSSDENRGGFGSTGVK